MVAQAKQPNFLIVCRRCSVARAFESLIFCTQIVADDLGFSDIGAFGSEVTFHLQSIDYGDAALTGCMNNVDFHAKLGQVGF
jgi:hypothetical protein